MKIEKIVLSQGRTGFFFDDQKAIRLGAKADGAAYTGEPALPGFTGVRQAGESISVQMVLEDGQIAHGDCAAVQYSGASGRDPLFLAEDFIPVIEEHVVPVFEQTEITEFRAMADKLDAIRVDGKPLHTAISYGVSQALLDAVAKKNKKMVCEVIADEYGTDVSATPIPVFSQTGDDRYINADKMILKRVDVLPHALINHVETKLGLHGEKLLDYVKWLSERIALLSGEDTYRPVIHLDVYGTIGQVFGEREYEKMADYLAALSEAAKPYALRIEGPMDAGGREAQIECMAGLRRCLDERGIPVEIVADEWCNNVDDIRAFADAKAGHMLQIKTPDLGGVQHIAESVLYCKEKGIGAYQGGTCNETDRSTQICIQIAMAVQPDQVLAKPGMGVDEGFMIVYNEMQRILALRKVR
ncbi:MAG: methylaspartate ammonia-lyase [Tissierellia bacterium]|jgi:methylaspartate ammonia-lyase|nr:methylaspartate ammonia-lyase [Bacillota bacterium]NLK58751.1 methylaspartate ammonia-lyase [Tissierellia bacterium]